MHGVHHSPFIDHRLEKLFELIVLVYETDYHLNNFLPQAEHVNYILDDLAGGLEGTVHLERVIEQKNMVLTVEYVIFRYPDKLSRWDYRLDGIRYYAVDQLLLNKINSIHIIAA